jgi:cobalamin biosynthesis protein CobT
MTESEPTHRVVRKAHRRSSNDGSPALVYEPGDTITPTDRELERFPGRFEAIPDEDEADDADMSETENSTDESAESAAESEADADTSEATDEAADAEDGDESAETDTESNEAPDGPTESGTLTAAWVESAEYAELRSAAGDYEGVNGNWGEDRLRAELLDRAEGGE